MVHSVVVLVIVLLLWKLGIFRFLYLVSKIQGPSLWDLATVHAQKLLGSEMLSHANKLCEHYSYKPWGFWTLTGQYLVVVSNEEDVKEVLTGKSTNMKPKLFYRVIADYLGEGTLSSPGGEKWRTHRKMASPAFKKETLEPNIDILNRGSENVIQGFQKKADGPAFDINDIIDCEMTNTSIRFLTSSRVLLDFPRFAKALADGVKFIHEGSVNPVSDWIRKKFHKPTKEREHNIRSFLGECRDIVRKVVAKACDDMKDDTREARDILDCGVKSMRKKGLNLSREDLVDESFNVAVAGIETTRTAIKMAVLLLALHEDVQQRVFDELQDIFGGSDRRATPEDLYKMEYLTMVIKESLRLFPSAPLLARQVIEDLNLNGTLIPKGVNVIANIMALQRNPDYYKDPLKFIPERFLPEISKNRSRHLFVPFSSGMRDCAGKLQAYMTMKCFLSNIVRNFKILPPEGVNCIHEIPIYVNMSLHVEKFVVKLTSREKCT